MLILLCAGFVSSAQAMEGGVAIEIFEDVEAGQRAHIARVNLCEPGFVLRATRPDEVGLRVSDFGRSVEALIAINGDFFDENMRPVGPAVGDGQRWEDTRVRPGRGFVAFGRGFAGILVGSDEGLDGSFREVVGGDRPLIREGAPASSARAFCTNRHPRTAIGLSQDRRTLFLVVVEGRLENAAGMTCDEVISLLETYAVHDALMMDGGGSSTMWVPDQGLVHRPFGFFERPVANHLAVIRGPLADSSCPESIKKPVALEPDIPTATPSKSVDTSESDRNALVSEGEDEKKDASNKKHIWASMLLIFISITLFIMTRFAIRR